MRNIFISGLFHIMIIILLSHWSFECCFAVRDKNKYLRTVPSNKEVFLCGL